MRRFSLLVFFYLSCQFVFSQKIDRRSVVERNCPTLTEIDTLGALTVGNGAFAYTVDITGLQSMPETYYNGISLCTQSEWGWHSFPNPNGYKPKEALKAYNLRHKIKDELYSCQIKENDRAKAASDWLRANPHRLNLGILGFKNIKPCDINSSIQTQDLWNGEIISKFKLRGNAHTVKTTCDGKRDMIATSIDYSDSITPIVLSLPYPTGNHTDGACDWESTDKHFSEITYSHPNGVVIRHTLDNTTYWIQLQWKGKAAISTLSQHTFCIEPSTKHFELTCEFLSHQNNFNSTNKLSYNSVLNNSKQNWNTFWEEGGFIDFGECTDERAKELERRVILSQYLLAAQCMGSIPPQETGLTMNSWFGKFHLEMILWHQAWLALWGHEKHLMRTLDWYFNAQPIAKEIAKRQGFKGVRWMKMTDPSGEEAPSNVGSFLIWQQPHPIYLAELCYQALKSEREKEEFVKHYMPIVQQTAAFMASFVQPVKRKGEKGYELRGYIPAQESLKADVTRNSPFELSQWFTALGMANEWRTRCGLKKNAKWEKIRNGLPSLAFNSDSLYLAAESATNTYLNIKATSDHPAILGALGFFPDNNLIEKSIMSNTLDWIIQNWNWPTAWGWDFPMSAMTATRLNRPETAIEILLLAAGKNRYLVNGHNYQDSRLRLYLPGNGALLSAIALMCAGWKDCNVTTPGFPSDGRWNVKFENILKLP